MRYECKAQKGLRVFTGSVISFLMLTSNSMASTVDQTAGTAVAAKPAEAVKVDKTIKTDEPTKVYADMETGAAAPDVAEKTSADQSKTTTVDSAKTTSTDEVTSQPAVADPYERYNRVMFDFDDRVDTTILKPVGTFYNKIMPKPLNQGVHNFFNNINNIPTIINDLLQFNFYQMTSDTWRLLINTTVGIGGIFDVASRMNLNQYDNDFGLTLAKWGYTNSNYLVLPFWGPKTLRDTIGMPVDYFAFSVYPYIQPTSTRYEIYGLAVVDARAQRLKVENVMDEASYDKYVFVRNAYMQNRAYKIKQNDHRTFADLDKGKPVSDLSESQLASTEDDNKPVADVAASKPVVTGENNNKTNSSIDKTKSAEENKSSD